MALHDGAGKITPTPGTPQRATQNLSDPTRRVGCHSFLVQALPGNTGKVYIGQAGLVRATLVGVDAILAIPTVNIIPSFSATVAFSVASFDLSGVWIDVDQPGDGVIVSYVAA